MEESFEKTLSLSTFDAVEHITFLRIVNRNVVSEDSE